MSKILRGLAAGYGAKKLGGGCFSTVLIFLILWWALGQCGGAFAQGTTDAAIPATAVASASFIAPVAGPELPALALP